jgi:light-independent protochlorophyllide reductase subunit B
VHPLMMGLEEHLLTMFREDSEFNDSASHLAGEIAMPALETAASETTILEAAAATWAPEAERELKKIPFFVRGKARRNTERFAQDQGLTAITVETLYDAKAHYGR